MAQYKRKDSVVEARQHDMEMSINVDSVKKGGQTARKGDFLVVDPSVEEGSKGSIYVISKADFLADFEIVEPAVAEPVAEEEKPAV